MKKPNQVILKLTDDEKAYIEKIANDAQLSISELVVLAVLALKPLRVPYTECKSQAKKRSFKKRLFYNVKEKSL